MGLCSPGVAGLSQGTLMLKVKERRRKQQGEEVCDPGENEKRGTQEYSSLLACLMRYSSH